MSQHQQLKKLSVGKALQLLFTGILIVPASKAMTTALSESRSGLGNTVVGFVTRMNPVSNLNASIYGTAMKPELFIWSCDQFYVQIQEYFYASVDIITAYFVSFSLRI